MCIHCVCVCVCVCSLQTVLVTVMDNNSFSQERVESVAMEAGSFADGQQQLQLEGDNNNIVIVMQGDNSGTDMPSANRATLSHAQGQVNQLFAVCRGNCLELFCGCFKHSQLQRITLGLKETFIVERTNKAEIDRQNKVKKWRVVWRIYEMKYS